ncbi:endo-beta-glucanase [Gloeophyllum trabeum ATCC 11539]|uniref:Endo-beta-glucanase n=1 Tax=Gloeophyllum trabeum (strain ATCC 11539 / FP-39264 / Madison 617) TaxID=670483 RepID=S7Q5T8_GLOTA|nr:endo-beta-glucanase [Gloeophyllum trabeum ATCC 11539]EPQ55426.1 endo-beta-glucanase [Gloeophyllum trabeum ATCC 11539]
MRSSISLGLPFVASLVSSAWAATYALSDNHVGQDFLTSFTHEAIPDPTSGRVNYVDQATALSKNLTFTSADSLIMRADDTTVLTASGSGRDSVRIKSVKTYTTHVAVFDVRHMPQGLSTWPAAWETLEDGWPASGEVDILEGANDVTPNQSTLHTSPGCTMPDGRAQTGAVVTEDCGDSGGANLGCGVHAPTSNSFGPAFNQNGGGWYAMERTSTFIKVWFWARNDPSVPADVSSGAQSVNTDAWGTSTAFFPNTDCDIASKFGQNNIIINLTFCGAWAGATFAQAGGQGDCATYVNNNPSAFSEAFWDIAAVRVYT